MVSSEKRVRARVVTALGCGFWALSCSSNPRSAGDGASGGGNGPDGFAGALVFYDSNGGSSSGAGAAANAAGGAAGSSGGSSGYDTPDASYPDLSFPFDPARVTPDACASVQGEATERRRPMDIIISIDNSSSMNSEIEEVQTRINQNFYDILEASGIDYRVVMVARYGAVSVSIGGSENPVHISPPLGGSTCPFQGDNNPCEPLAFPAHGKFFHMSADIESRDMWQKLLGGLFNPDELETDSTNFRDGGDQFSPWVVRAPTGYDEFLREDSFKVILGITDDGISGSEYSSSAPNGASWNFQSTSNDNDHLAAAQQFDTALRQISPEHFGALEAERNYRYYAIAGFHTDDYVTLAPDAPVVTEVCVDTDGNDGARAGQGHQELARLTGGLRYSSCRTSNYDPIFSAIAQAVVEGAQVPCEFDVPAPPGGQLIDVERLVVAWTHDGGSEILPRVDSCTGAGYRLDFSTPDAGVSSQPQRLLLCADSCTAVQAEASSQLSVDFGCIGQ